ncbi:hypothetical protein [Eubacterium oxidoreducens]|uniref:Uncharacterized protein n=1 Tax=Eubacterium oxidoreducens TaxID=1732 RepID=A0A1G6AGL0_EUBOX|nr:hypothetical protein [Eubacterium oxidoreducens]SDB07571.1 hypothetical protein SAMN02910417_00566 [Eubacterium oxidoreducens]
MSLAISPISSVSTKVVQPINYALKNEADVSDAYVSQVKQQNKIDDVSPVIYPTSQVMKQTESVDLSARLEKAQQVAQGYNEIASSFGGATVGYASDRSALAYQAIGAGFDMYA